MSSSEEPPPQHPSKISTMRPQIQNRLQKRPIPPTTPTRTLNCPKKLQPPPRQKKQESLSELVMITNTKNDSVKNNTNHEVKDGNVQIMI